MIDWSGCNYLNSSWSFQHCLFRYTCILWSALVTKNIIRTGGGPLRCRCVSAANWAPPIRRWTTGHRAVSAPDISVPFPDLFLFFELWRKNNEAGNSLNSVECEPVPSRVLNPIASEASYKPKKRSYRKTKLKKIKTWCPIVQAPNGGAQSAAPKRTRPSNWCQRK